MYFPVPEMTYNVFSGTLNPAHFTSLLLLLLLLLLNSREGMEL